MNVKLTASEVLMASNVGRSRHMRALLREQRPRFAEEYPGRLWAAHIEGACAELAVAKVLGVYWAGTIDTYRAADMVFLGHDVEVRWRADGAFLKVRERDPDDRVVVLVKGQCPAYEIVGWILGRHAKENMWRRDPHQRGKPAYFVPWNNLQPIERLK